MNLEAERRGFRDVPTARLATIARDGTPHVAPLWFVWLPEALFLSTAVGSATWINCERDPRVGLVIDRGLDWSELAGIQAEGIAELLPAQHPDVRSAMSAWHEKYRSVFSGDGFERFTAKLQELGFLKLEPSRTRVWDHARSDGAIAGPSGHA